MRETFTVRKQSFGVGVERTFPVHSPKIEKIEVQAIGDVNRAKLYYLRGKVGKKARVREIRGPRAAAAREAATVAEPVAEEVPAEAEETAVEAQEPETEAVVAEAQDAPGDEVAEAETEAERGRGPAARVSVGLDASDRASGRGRARHKAQRVAPTL